MKYWLMKVEPSAYSIEALERDGTTNWEGVRNYQARNFMRDEMRTGDKVLFYASNAKPSGVTGLAEVSGEARPEPADPTWVMVEIRFVAKFPEVVSLDTLKQTPGLENMLVTKKGMRLSIQPVTKAEYDIVVKLGVTSEMSSLISAAGQRSTASDQALPTSAAGRAGLGRKQ